MKNAISAFSARSDGHGAPAWSRYDRNCDKDDVQEERKIAPQLAKTDELKRWGRNYWEAVHPFNMDGYFNLMMDDEGDARVMASYGSNYPRLAAVKHRYDPETLFRVNQNIKPAG